MLFLLFQLAKDRYALDAGQVAEVLPWVGIKQIPQARRVKWPAYSITAARRCR